jgi:hypothetical protein
MPKASLLDRLSRIMTNKNTTNPLFSRDLGLYYTKLKVYGKNYKIISEVELVRSFSGPIKEVQIRHNKVNKIEKRFEKEALRILEEEHLLVGMEDVKWN